MSRLARSAAMSSGWRRKMSAVLLAMSLAACASSASEPAAAPGGNAEVDAYIAAQMRDQHIPGLSLAVVQDGRTVYTRAYGVSNLELGTPTSLQTVFKIGSVSKQFIASGIMLLNGEGRLNLDDSIVQYLDGAPASWRPITIRHLLGHTSGLPLEAPGFDPLKDQTEADLIRTAYATPLRFAPGSRWEYCNLGYFILAEIISKAAQKPWDQYMHDRVFAPLGMNATRTTTNEAVIPNRANGYNWENNAYHNAEILIEVRPSGAFVSTIEDLAKWEAALASGRVLSAEQIAMMQAPVRLSDGAERPYGFGWEVARYNGHRLIHHGGTLAGFRASFSRFVDDKLTVIVLTNSISVPDRIARGVAGFYVPELQTRVRTSIAVSPALLDQYAGDYNVGNNRTLRVARRNDRLHLTLIFGERSLELGLLSAESETRFFNEQDPRNTYVFSPNAQGAIQMQLLNEAGEVQSTAPKIAPAN